MRVTFYKMSCKTSVYNDKINALCVNDSLWTYSDKTRENEHAKAASNSSDKIMLAAGPISFS